MDAVEIADGDDWITKRLRDKIEVMIDDHIFSGITGFSSSFPLLYFLLGVVVNMELTTAKIYYTNIDEIVTTNKNYSF